MDSNQQQVLRYLATLERQLIKIYGSSYQAAIEIAEVRRAIENGDTFTWSGNKQAANRLDKILQQMTAKVETLIANGVAASYRQGEKSVEGDVIKALGVRSKAQKAEVTAICESATDSRRAAGQGAHAHLNARRGGMQASAKIWQQNAKQELEIIIQNGIKEGKSPSDIAQSIRPYLIEPNRYEKSVLNPETGKLERSDAAKKYHPGQGVYRSSYKNALRMARTEMTVAYREAEWESYQNNPLIKAYEIRLSGNHTTMKVVKGKRVPVPLTDICDKLAGVYPKSFKWTGWHPQCRCVMIPITISKSEFGELLDARQADRKAKREGKEATAVAKLEQRAAQKQLPKQYTDWLAANHDRITAAKKAGLKLPQWLADNEQVAQVVAATATIATTSPNAPATLTPEQLKVWVENELKVAQELGIERGEPMTFEQANEQKGNPHYVKGSGDGYTVNCQSCVVAHELRRRGYDVEAWYNTEQEGNIPYELSGKTNWAWIDPATGQMPEKVKCNNLTLKGTRVTGQSIGAIAKNIVEATQEPGRYHIEWSWKGGKDGHIITVERLQNGLLRFYDPQTGKITPWKSFKNDISTSRSVNVLRVDNLLINDAIIKGVVAKAGTTKSFSKVDPLLKTKQTAYKNFIAVRDKMGWSPQKIIDSMKRLYGKDFEEIFEYIKHQELGGIGSAESGKPISKLPEETRQRRVEIRAKAKATILNKKFQNNKFGKTITINNKAIKEWLNQPFKYYEEKNELLLKIDEVIRDAEYLGIAIDKHHPNNNAHIFETNIHGEKFWIIAIEDQQGNIVVHSISDSPRIKEFIK